MLHVLVKMRYPLGKKKTDSQKSILAANVNRPKFATKIETKLGAHLNKKQFPSKGISDQKFLTENLTSERAQRDILTSQRGINAFLLKRTFSNVILYSIWLEYFLKS